MAYIVLEISLHGAFARMSLPRLASMTLSITLLCMATAPAYAASKAMGEVLVPHKALYNIEMISKRSSSQVINIHGQMYFALQSTCEAWSTDHRFNLFYEYADSPPMQITSDFTTYEPLDGQSFDFSSRRRRDGELYEELRGTAVRQDDGTGIVTYSVPEGLTFEVPQDGLFPMAHTEAMMKFIREGKKTFNATVFDGSDEEGPIEINTIIGKTIDTPSLNPGKGIDAALLAPPAHKVRMAFFPLANDNESSDYEMDVVLHDNGVISAMTVDYGEFSVSQKLVALEKYDTPACGNGMPSTAEKTESQKEEPKPRKKLFGIIP